jgi:hypothetical protein
VTVTSEGRCGKRRLAVGLGKIIRPIDRDDSLASTKNTGTTTYHRPLTPGSDGKSHDQQELEGDGAAIECDSCRRGCDGDVTGRSP